MTQSEEDLILENKISRIIKMELEITEAISRGHKTKEDDQFKEYRSELKALRDELDLKRRAQ